VAGRKVLLLLAALIASSIPSTARGQAADLQREISDSRMRLEEIRAEREQLQREMEGFLTRARDVSASSRTSSDSSVRRGPRSPRSISRWRP